MPTTRDMPYRRLFEIVSAYDANGYRDGSNPFILRSTEAAGWNERAMVYDLTDEGMPKLSQLLVSLTSIRLSTAAVRASGGSESTFRGLEMKWWGCGGS
ncbi:hypothetical protein EVAR_56975_1 [Eumeta japonica]|uniref:Uncharacterized protein n=1 Tax=Eumeta variegata TaxID=151549 RepID=A0A4C1Z632_EUMVA|nr:hypothetical protein EVAR_56975_1 [Eumeta japonica]